MDRRDFLKAAGTATTFALAGARLSAQDDLEIPRHYLYPYTCRLDMERGFKFHCLVPGETDVGFGRHEYAGFFTLRVGDGPWMFAGDRPPEHVAAPDTLEDLRRGEFAIGRNRDGLEIGQAVQWDAGRPYTVLGGQVKPTPDAPVVGALMGWQWAERNAPTRWWVGGEWREPAGGDEIDLSGSPQIAFVDEHGPFVGVLHFTRQPVRAWADGDGLYWEWAPDAEGQSVRLSRGLYLLAPGALTDSEIDQLAALLQREAEPRRGRVRWPEWVPPGLAAYVAGAEPTVISVAGPLLLTTDPPTFEPPPELETPIPQVSGEGVLGTVEAHILELLRYREPDGRFTFSLGRTFYDALTCAALAQALPVLGEPQRSRTAEAVRDCLDALCDGHVRSDAYGLLVPPEQEGFVRTAIDYPEIAGCLLYAMLAYTLNADARYAATRRDLLETHHSQIKQMVTPEGLSWARADTAQVHLIAESAIGGYVALASLHHLARYVPGASWADVCEGPARTAWAAYRELFRWRPEFAETGVVSGWSNWCCETRMVEPWAYVQTTWFSFVPMVPFEHEDRYHLWRSLREQPWWDYTGTQGSRQRCYDYANALALARAGYADEVREHWEAIDGRPFWYDTFDATPVMAVAALPQLAAMGVP